MRKIKSMLHALGHNIWRIDGPEITFAGAAMHTRMTVVKLSNGSLWIHSPVELNDDVRSHLAELGGEVVALVAPNKFHHLYMSAWQAAFPNAQVFAEPKLKEKVPALKHAQTITNEAPSLYREEIDQLIMSGNRLFQEAIFFHRPSRTLILTDLMINLEIARANFLARLFYRFEGVVYPSGGIPRLYKWFTTDKDAARAQVQTIMDWKPAQITFCHGHDFAEDTNTVIRREFAWLLE